MRLQRGFTLIETLVGLLILAFILTTSLMVFVERQRRLRHADETIVAYQALANEVEITRVIPFSSLTPGETTFRSDTVILAGLDSPETRVTVENWKGARRVELSIEWNGGARVARMTVIRANPGNGRSLW